VEIIECEREIETRLPGLISENEENAMSNETHEFAKYLDEEHFFYVIKYLGYYSPRLRIYFAEEYVQDNPLDEIKKKVAEAEMAIAEGPNPTIRFFSSGEPLGENDWLEVKQYLERNYHK
jgi:hypothetical protein